MSTGGNTESVAVQIAPIIVEVELSEPRTNETDIWNNNISQLFPIASISQKGDKVMAFIDIPFSGYTIETGISNGVFEGKAIVRDTNNVIIAKFHYSDGKPSGKCKAYLQECFVKDIVRELGLNMIGRGMCCFMDISTTEREDSR